MTLYYSKMSTVTRQAIGYLSHLFGGTSTSSRVGSVEPNSKVATTAVNPTADPTTTNNVVSVEQPKMANSTNSDVCRQPPAAVVQPTRQRSLDSTEVFNWEPDLEEKELIKLTWSDDFDFLYQLGSNIYEFIFKHNPDCKTLFPAIHAHGDDYRESREFRSQALKFVQTISYTVRYVYNMDNVSPHLYRVGERHVKFADRGFKAEHWDVFLDAMESALTEQINSIAAFDDEQRRRAIRVWRRMAFYIITHMKHGFFDMLDRQKNETH